MLHITRDIADSFSDSYLQGVISIQKKTDPCLFIHIQAMTTEAKLSPPATAQKEWPNRFRFGALCHLIKGAQTTGCSFLEVVKSWSLLLFSDCSQLTVNNTFPRNLCIWWFCLGNNRSYILLLGSIEIKTSSSFFFSVNCDMRNLPHKWACHLKTMTNVQSQHPHATMKMTQQGTHAQNPDMNHLQKANSLFWLIIT